MSLILSRTRGVTFLVANGLLVLTTGCDSYAIGPFDGEVCLEGQRSMEELALDGGADYLRWRSRPTSSSDDPIGTLASWGDACSGATDVDACRTALETTEMHWQNTNDALISIGDDVIRLDSSVDLLELFESVDTPTRAALYAGFNGGRTFPCGENNWRREGDGFTLKARSHTHCRDKTSKRMVDYEVTVRPGGTIDTGAPVLVEGDECSDERR